MKKNMMMRLASVLLIAVLMSTCAISGTFAKYVTSGEGTDTARVAKFGVVVKGTSGGDNQAFAQEYASNDADFASVTVAASENVVAPGTSGTFSNFNVSGIPEVAVRVTYTPTVTFTNWKIEGSEYCPIIIYVNDTPYYINNIDIKTIDDLQNTVAAAIQAATKDYAPGTNLSAVNGDLNIRWEWAYVGGTPTQNDVNDTKLGDLAAEADEDAKKIKIEITVTCTVTQID